MKLDTEFYKLPLRIHAERLAAEALQFAESDWRPHPQGYPGNSAISLIAVNGDPGNDAVAGPMRPTPYLERCPYVCQILAELGAVLGRTRFMRIAGQSEATQHVDTNYYWMHHVRVHLPAVTQPEVRFLCNDKEVHMAAGEVWIFDTWKLHNVLNPVSSARIHLVVDTVGSADFWELVAGSERPFDPRPGTLASRTVPFIPGVRPELATESVNFPVVMTPWEQKCLLTDLFDDLTQVEPIESDLVVKLETLLERFHHTWLALWARYGVAEVGFPYYSAILNELDESLNPFQGRLSLPNAMDVTEIIKQIIIRPGLNPSLACCATSVPITASLERPIFIVAAPRSGSTLLFETLARSPDVWTIGGESHEVIEGIAPLTPAQHDWESNRLTAADANAVVADALRKGFLTRLRDRDGRSVPSGTRAVRLLEKTPKNALRIPFLRAVFPDARFIYLHRDPAENLSSIMEAWRSQQFVTYPELPHWGDPPWSLLLIPGWQQLRGKPLAEIAAAQWETANRQILDDLEELPASSWCSVSYAELLANPQATAERLCNFAGISWDQQLSGTLPLSRHTLTAPAADKWRKNETELRSVLPQVAKTAQRALPTQVPRIVEKLTSSEKPVHMPSASSDEPLRSVHTASFAHLLKQLNISLLVTTYQAGKLILLRVDAEGRLNTHFRNFPSPMGLAFRSGRLALGTKDNVWEFTNQPAVGLKREPVADACFMPRWMHFTGDIRIHEIAWGGEELWIVNTRFSCLCTLDQRHSFVPRWRPPFITALLPEDRCHLNGMGMRDGKPAYATCLGATDSVNGWRVNKQNGGLLLEVPSGEVIARGLSMPHSPRWYDDKLWLLESGVGGIGTVALGTGRMNSIAELPGFTRGLDFHGPYAFIGLSQVRETAMFSGIPITERKQERVSGVWVVDLRNGATVAFLRFEDLVQEVFAVQVLPGIVFPELLTEDDAISNSFVLPD